MKSSWTKLLSREGTDVTTISAIDVVCFSLIWDFTKTRDELFFTHVLGKHFTHYIGVDAQELGRFIYKKYFNSQKQLEECYSQGEQLLSDTLKKTSVWKKKLEKNNSEENLLAAFAEFRKDFELVCQTYCITSWFGLEAWQNDFDKMLSQLIKDNNLVGEQEKILASAYVPWKKTLARKLEERLSKGESIDKILREAQVLRSWSAVWYRPIDESWVKSLTQNKPSYEIYSQEDLVKLLKPDKSQEHFLEMAPYIVFFKDYRDDVRRSYAYYWTFFFEDLAKCFRITPFEVGYLSLSEIQHFLEHNRSKMLSLIEKRRNAPLVVTAIDDTLVMKVIDENIPEKYSRIMNEVDSQEKQMQIKGTIAQKGKVVGKVKIVRSFHDVKHVKAGDILVANTTHPNYLSAMQNAAAFVTNEGGVISHAAIVARELKKPCLVGTKVATKVLADGDLVEVDADNGIVRIISKK